MKNKELHLVYQASVNERLANQVREEQDNTFYLLLVQHLRQLLKD